MGSLEIDISISRKNDGFSVAEELIENTILKENPKALFLFATIHYEKEFSKILNLLKDYFNNVPLVGGR
ncbi:MAG: hypothetical protein V5A68_04950 [Candidatus Thermoplasmatota archaeon]